MWPRLNPGVQSAPPSKGVVAGSNPAGRAFRFDAAYNDPPKLSRPLTPTSLSSNLTLCRRSTATNQSGPTARNRRSRSWSSCASSPTMRPAYSICRGSATRQTANTPSARNAGKSASSKYATARGVSHGRAPAADSTSTQRPERSSPSPRPRCTSGTTRRTSWLALAAASLPNS